MSPIGTVISSFSPRRFRSRRLVRYLALSLVAGLAVPRQGLGQDSLPGAGSRPSYPSPALRPLLIQSGLLPGRRLLTAQRGGPLREATAYAGHQLRAVGMVPLLLSRPLVVLAGFSYLREQGSYDREPASPQRRATPLAYLRHDVALSLTFIRQDSLFRRPVLYMASVTGMSRSVGGLEKITGGATALLTLRGSPQTKLAAGFTAQLNPSVSLPLLPVLSYWHRLGQSPWEIDALLPLRAHLRRPLLANKCWLSLGTEMLSTHSFGSGIGPWPAATVEASTTSAQTGVLFEYVLGPYCLVGIRGGLDTPVAMSLSQKNSPDPIWQTSAANTAYVGLNFSLTMPTKKQ